MKHHRVPASFRQRRFERVDGPVVEIDSGDLVTFETSDDAYARLWRGVSPELIPDEDYNLLTGPVVVRTAEPGDVLRIDIQQIEIHRAWAVSIPGFGPLGDRSTDVHVEQLAIRGKQLWLSERLSVSLKPMVGCIGLAPATGSASSLEPAYAFGGNLDVCELTCGASLSLPVQTAGAWLAVGDLHAAMGAGEPAHVGIEAAGTVTARVYLEKHRPLAAPEIDLPGRTLCVAVMDLDGSLEEAAELATRRAYLLLQTRFGLNSTEAYAYVCASVALRFGGPASPMVLADVPHPPCSTAPEAQTGPGDFSEAE